MKRPLPERDDLLTRDETAVALTAAGYPIRSATSCVTTEGNTAQLADARQLQAEGLGYASIGQRLGLSKGQVRHLLMREKLNGIRHLLMREKLNGIDGDSPTAPQGFDLDPRGG